eukprot:9062244-Prorocentrum_lima.AAC.1
MKTGRRSAPRMEICAEGRTRLSMPATIRFPSVEDARDTARVEIPTRAMLEEHELQKPRCV